MDVKTTFQNDIVQEEVYIKKPQGFEVHGRESHVCRLKKALHDLKWDQGDWYSQIGTYLRQLGFQKSDVDLNLYFILFGEDPLIPMIYVDDLFITRIERLIEGCKKDLASQLEMEDIVLMHYFLGLEVWQEEGHIFLGQGSYTIDIMRRFRMGDCRPMSTPIITNQKKLHAFDSKLVDPTLYHHLIGTLMHLVNTRLDICFVVNSLSQFMVEPRRVHQLAMKHVLRYLQGTIDYGLDYRHGDGVRLEEYTDLDWARCASNRKSTSGCCFGLGLVVVLWFSRKQKLVALRPAEAEHMEVNQVSHESIWIHNMLVGLLGQRLKPMVIYCDNQRCIKLTENPIFHYR